MKKYNAVQKAHLKKLEKWKTIWFIWGMIGIVCFLFAIFLVCSNWGTQIDSNGTIVSKYIARIPTPIYSVLWIVNATVYLIHLIIVIPGTIYINKKLKWIKKQS
jgi:hypothetical protein